MVSVIVFCFIIGYLVIVFEYLLCFDKMVLLLLMGVLCWVFLVIGFNNGVFEVVDMYDYVYLMMVEYGEGYGVEGGDGYVGDVYDEVEEGFINMLLYYFGKIVEIFVFLIGVMMIVEIIDLYCGFEVFKGWVNMRFKVWLLWIIGGLLFIFLVIIDNFMVMIVFVMLL